MSDTNLSAFLWSVADLLRGDFKQSDYGKVILPFTVLRRLDCVLENTKAAVLKEHEARSKAKVNPEPFLLRKSGVHFYNVSPLDLKKLLGDADHIAENLRSVDVRADASVDERTAGDPGGVDLAATCLTTRFLQQPAAVMGDVCVLGLRSGQQAAARLPGVPWVTPSDALDGTEARARHSSRTATVLDSGGAP